MPQPTNQLSDRHRRASSKESEDEDAAASTTPAPPSHNLYVGNLSLDTTEAELSALFSKYGALDRVTTYPSRNYAFVYFKHVDDARAAKDTLQGALVRGNSIKIQFAKPAKVSKHLWIGGLSPAVTRKQLEVEFSKFGEIEELKLLKDRNSAFVDYYKIEDAADATKNMDGKSLCGEKIRVDYVRSQPSRRDWTDYHDRWMPSESFRNFPGTSQLGNKRPLSNEGRKGGQPSKVLWIRYPPSVPIDEQMLHNALILFGEIERIKTFPGRNYSFVEFRSVEEAWRAKEGLQGRLFNDPRIQIMFSYSELAPTQDGSPFFPGNRGPRADVFFSEPPFGSMEGFAPSGLMGSNNLPGHLPPNVMHGSNVPMRPFAQAFDPIHGGPEFSEVGGLGHNFADGNSIPWRRGSPSAPGILPSPGMRPPVRTSQGAWDEFDARDLKRSRFDGPSLIDDVPFHARRMGSQERYGLTQLDRDSLGWMLRSPIRVNGPPVNVSSHGDPHGVRSDHCWRGLIAKGGTPVCHARCIPIGNGVDSPIPEVVNCSARTGLDMLAKHYTEASGFDIVFFLPDSEEDFASYTEFLRYLGAKNRAGVAKFDDGTTLFLVPPSDFLTRTLKVSGPERLYGIVLKLPQQSTTVPLQHPQTIPPSTSQYADRQQLPPQTGFDGDQTRLEYSRTPRENLGPHMAGGLLVPHAEESHATPPSSLGFISNATVTPQVGVSLPQDLLASLASLVPSGIQSSATGTVQLPLNASTRLVGSSVIPDKVAAPQGWSQAPQEQLRHASQQAANQVGSHSSHLQFSNYGNIGNASDYPIQSVSGGLQIQDPTINVQNVSNLHAKPTDSYTYPSQGGTSTSSANQQYHLDASYSSHKSYGMTPADIVGGYNSSVQQSMTPSISSAQDQSGRIVQPQSVLPLATDKGSTELPTQLQQLQAAISNSAQSTTIGEADKNQRYQSTLQFAASLLLQIQQQQQQQGNTQSMQGSGNQQ